MNYDSTPVLQNKVEITPEQQKIIDSLTTPEPESYYQHDFKEASQILTLLFQGQGWTIGSQYEPCYFEDDAHSKIFKVLKDCWNDNHAIMSKEVLMTVLADKYAENPHQLAILGEAEVIAHGFGSSADSPTIQKLMLRFALQQGTRKAISETMDMMKQKKPFEQIWEKWNKLQTMKHNIRDNPIQTWNEMKLEAESESAIPIIEGLLQTKSMNMISGRSFSGKTTLINKAIAAICEGSDFLGHQTNPVAVCYLNCDRNRVSRIVRKVRNNMTTEDADEILSKRFFSVHLDSLATTLTANDLRTYHKALQKHIGDTPVLFIVDTFRSAFLAEAEMGATNDDSTMVKLLKPIQEWAISTGNAILLIHHNTKSLDDYSGSGAFLMLLEAKMNYKRNEQDSTGELQIITRDDLCLNYHIRLDDQFRPYRCDKGSEDLEKVVASFGNHTTVADAFSVYQAGGGSWEQGKFYRSVNDAAIKGLLVVKGKAAGRKAAIYARS